MVIISKFSPVLLLLLTLFLSSAFLSLGFSEMTTRYPESPRRKYQQCQQQCREEEQGEKQQQQCQLRCEKQYQKERRSESEDQEGQEDPRQEYRECQESCERRYEGRSQEQHKCQQKCQRELEEQQEEERSRHHGNPQEEEQRNNPFFFHSRTFQSRFRSEHGSVSVLPRFSKKSRILRGIENYRLLVLEANPNTFVLPQHCDAEAVFVVLKGQGTVTFVNDEKRQSFNLKCGNVIRVPAGTTVYMVNPESNEKLIIAALKKPVNAPGKFEEFFPAGGENPQAYYNVFSDEVLEAVLNTPRDQLKKLFQEQKEEGMIRRASKEQLRALSKESSSSPRQRESESSSPIDLLNQRPLYSNQNGVFHEACPDEFKQLRDTDVAVGALDMKQGTIFVPHYHTKQTTVFLVTEGAGQFEMACPRRSQQSEEQEEEEEEEEEEEQRSGQFRKITARVKQGDIFVIPAGYPVTLIASNENLRGFSFGINAENSKRIFLAGRNNVVKNLEREAQELSFGVPARQVQQVFGNQEESHFVSRQRQQRREGRGENHLNSILDFARLF